MSEKKPRREEEIIEDVCEPGSQGITLGQLFLELSLEEMTADLEVISEMIRRELEEHTIH